MVEVSERIRRLAASGGWIGVDLDGTLFTYTEWVSWNAFGEPIRPMIERVQAWIKLNIGVRIVTARVGLPIGQKYPSGNWIPDDRAYNVCRVTGERFSDWMMVRAIGGHCLHHGLPRLLVQPHKDVDMIELWDDRAVQVIANTGRTLAEEHAAELTAQQGKQFQKD
jgi:hypothetical protein